MPYPYNKSNLKHLNKKIQYFRQQQQHKWEEYRKQQILERAAAQMQLELLETNLTDRIDRASARYNDIVSYCILQNPRHTAYI